tara:strand:+ start:141 stop:878 length:738 start_codon:yes stop_codon:yes gene_type:complete
MTEEYGDTGYGSIEDSQTSGDLTGDGNAETGETGGPELDEKGNPAPIPYERFKESRTQLHEAKSNLSRMQQEIDALRASNQQQVEWNQRAWEQLQQQQSASQQGYEDPLFEPELSEKNVKRIEQLERQLEQQRREYVQKTQAIEIANAERQIMSEVNAARQKYPEMREVDVINAIANNPGASVMALAKRSHEKEVAAFEQRVKKRGYKSPPKSLQRGRGPSAVKQDFGTDLDAAEAAARAFLSGD